MLNLAVVGAGLMGRGIARAACNTGHQVAIYDSLPAALEQVEGDVRAGRSLADTVADADLVIEAIAEDLPAKQRLFGELDGLTGAVLATNTSVLQITKIARDVRRPERVVGTHWWNPPDLVPLVEVVRGRHTGDTTMEWTVEALTLLGKVPVRVERDVPGFVGNRLQHALWREAIDLVESGVCDAATVDLVVRNTLGLKLGVMGPLENADYVGLDLTLAIHRAVLPSLCRDTGPAELLREHVAGGDLGAKTGQGFLPWPDGARDAAAARLADHVRRHLPIGGRPSAGPAGISEESS